MGQIEDMTLASVKKFAARSPLFSQMEEQALRYLAAHGEIVTHGVGDVVVRQGDPSTTFYLLVDGRARVSVDESEVAQLSAGSFFGEMGVITGEPRSASVEITEAAQMVRFEQEVLVEILKRFPKLREGLSRVGLQRTEANMQSMLNDGGSGGLADLLEPDDLPDAAERSMSELMADVLHLGRGKGGKGS